MSIKSLLTRGSSEAGTWENIADTVLAIPRAVWLSKEVTVQKKGNAVTLDSSKFSRDILGNQSFSKSFLDAFFSTDDNMLAKSFAFTLFGLPIITIISLVAAPILGIGLIIKKIALYRDPVAAKINKFVDEYYEWRDPRVDPLIDEFKEELHMPAYLESHDAYIENDHSLSDSIKEIFSKQFRATLK